MSSPDLLNADQLRAALGETVIGREIVVLETTASTNDSILEMTTPKTEEGFIVFAEHQTAGRGQRHNQWESAAHKGLWFSILLRPQIEVGQSTRLTTWLAQTVAGTVQEELSLPAAIKTPNDVIVDSRKVAGVLVEMRAQPAAPHVAIAGVGVNVNQTADDFSIELRSRAVSLAMASGRKIDRPKFAIALLRNLDRTYRDLLGS